MTSDLSFWADLLSQHFLLPIVVMEACEEHHSVLLYVEDH